MIFALLDNDVVTDVYTAEPDTPFATLFPNKQAIVVSDETGIPFPGYLYKNGVFTKGDA